MVAAEWTKPAPVLGWLRSRPRLRAALQRNLTGWLFILPALIRILCLLPLPDVLRAVEISLTDWNLDAGAEIHRPRQLRQAGGRIRGSWQLRCGSPWPTWSTTSRCRPCSASATCPALMDRLSKSVALRAIVIAPYLLSNVIAALIWLWLLDPLLGMTNVVLGLIGVPHQAFLASPDLAIVSVAAINIWRHVGLTALLFYAGLQAIPRSLQEAARLEGAGEWTVFRRVTLPLLRPVLVFVLVTSVIGSFQVFDTIAVATQGGPANSTSAIIWYVYESAFRFSKMGYASAMSVALFAVLILITILQMRALRAGSSDLE